MLTVLTSPDTAAATTSPARTRWTRRDKARITGISGFVLLLHVVGWGMLVLIVAPSHYSLGTTGTFTIGLGATAYIFGARHAFDPDHIAAIDNTTRKLAGERQRPLSIGFWFSLGHSTVVFVLCLLIGLGARALASQVADDSSPLKNVAGVVGTLVSGTFLVLIGLINLSSLVGIARVFRRLRGGQLDEAELEHHLSNRGFLGRLLRGTTRAVKKPWQMYPVGLLFGLGFDTTSEVSLLVLAGGAAAFALPWYAVLTLPVLFAAGMSLLDAADGIFMTAAYEWAFLNPVRKVFYNLTMTALSVAVALLIGTVELLGLLAKKLGVSGGALGWVDTLSGGYIGYGVVALFLLTWLGAVAYWRLAKVEERWAR
jgi:high-affinity nickel-transport protein